jgi:hypothetical protein
LSGSSSVVTVWDLSNDLHRPWHVPA